MISSACISAPFLTGCERCSDSNIEKHGDAVIWELIPFGISEETFIIQTASLMAVVPPKRDLTCKEQITMPYPDLDEKEIVERPGGDLTLTACTIRAHSAEQTSTLLEIKGEFVADELSRLVFRFTSSQAVNVEESLKKRFGEGDTVTVKEQVIIEETPASYRYWRDKKEVWLLTRGTNDTVLLIHQDLVSGATLKKPAPIAEKGKPVSLDDIGLGGKLDLNAPLPNLDDLEIPPDNDASAAPPTPSSERNETQP